MSEKILVIVESPTKAKTITKFLGSNYVVKASNGHIRDLPNSAKEIPLKLKKEGWATIGVNIAADFEPLYIIPPNKKENVAALKEALTGAKMLYLATDEDREGESISWHIVETLKPKIPTKRLVFHEITKEAIKASLDSAREIDENLVKAQETRRIVDRLYGYEISPLLWKKMLPRLSAGRVQSVAVRLLVERERERMRFREACYWGLGAKFLKPEAPPPFDAELTHLGKKRLAISKDFNPDTGKIDSKQELVVLGKEEAERLQNTLTKEKAVVSSVEEKPFSAKPLPPFVTSTLQQEANYKLRLPAKRTMTIAQTLYENGFITYMRTDSTTLSAQAINAARTLIDAEYGKDYLPKEPRIYVTKVKNAQEAHEAIRPAGDAFTPPEVVQNQLGAEAFKLYDLIWKRTVASQMADARGTYTAVDISCGDALFRTKGKSISFAGYLRAYVEGSDDPDAEIADQERILPKLVQGDVLNIESLTPSEHITKPPPRYTEGSLIKELERRGIGRPSTWASVVELVLSRYYAFKKNNALVPTFVALAVVNLLEKHFTQLLDYEFTARLEDDLDAIARGEAMNVQYLKSFYFGNGHKGLRALVETGEKVIDPREVCGVPIGTGKNGQAIEVRIGKYGPFITDGTNRSSVPEMFAPDEITVEKAEELLAASSKDAEALGKDPATGLSIYLKTGRFGPYVQLGENATSADDKPKMASFLPNMKREDVSMDVALQLLSLPRTIGTHPTLQQPIVAANGRFGPYVKCGTETRSIPADLATPISITLEQATELLNTPKSNRRASVQQTLREVGKHPVSGLVLNIKSGRYGPYVTDGTINASLTRGTSPETLTIEEAVSLLDARAARLAEEGGTGKKRTKKTTAKTPKAKSKGKKKASSASSESSA